MPGWSPWDLLVLLFLALLLFGAKRLPEIGRGTGQMFREFKQALTFGGDADASPRELTTPAKKRR